MARPPSIPCSLLNSLLFHAPTFLPRLDLSFLLGLSPRWLGVSPRWLGVSPRCEPLAGAGSFPISFLTLSFFGAIAG